MLAFLQGAGRADHAAAFGCEEPGDVGADAAARPGDHHDLAVESTHEILRAAILHGSRARSTGRGLGLGGGDAQALAGEDAVRPLEAVPARELRRGNSVLPGDAPDRVARLHDVDA